MIYLSFFKPKIQTIMKNIFVLIFFSLVGNLLFAQANYQIVVSTDFEGKVLSGSIDSLIQEIRKGKPVRVGWQLDFNKDHEPDFDHWVDAGFITILGGHVFAQIETIYAQGPNIKTPQVEIFPVSDQWTAVLGTNGKLLNRFILEFDAPNFAQNEVDNKIEKTEALENRKKFNEMIQVRTWEVATFWAVPK